MGPWVLLVLTLLLWPAWAWAGVNTGIIVSELTSGGALSTSSGTTASVAPTKDSTLLLFFTWRSVGCSLSSVSGMSLTWTEVRTVQTAGGVSNHAAYRAISDGTAGTITMSYSSNCDSLVWSVVEVKFVPLTAASQGIVGAATSNVTQGSGTLGQGWDTYRNAHNTQITSCSVGDGGTGATFTIDSDPGWEKGATAATGTGSVFRALVSSWLTARRSDTQADCTWTVAGLSHYILITVEVAAGPIRIRSQQ